MNGLELARAYYEEYGRDMIHSQFADIEPLIAAGLCGSGSECFGFDDGVSEDHDFEPGFCIFIPGEDKVSRDAAFRLERAYAKLPKEFMGYKRSMMAPVGGSRHGVIRMDEFFASRTGSPDGCLSADSWLSVPEYSLLETVNGEVFSDPSGVFTAVRERLKAMPEDARKKRLAGNLLLMAQSGQYNYRRCLEHGETGAAQLAVMEFAKSMMAAVFLLNREYMPYYKWSFRAMRELPLLSVLADAAEYLITTGNDGEMAEDKYFVIEDSASAVIDELMNQDITRATCGDLEKHAYSVNDLISDSYIRNLNILCAV